MPISVRSLAAASTLFIGVLFLGLPAQAQSSAITVGVAPPALRVEVVPPAPVASYVWAPGYWGRSAAQWVWVGGTWTAPSPRYRHYTRATWVRSGNRWVFRNGGFSDRTGGVVRVAQHRPVPKVIKSKRAVKNQKAKRTKAKANRNNAKGKKGKRKTKR